MRGSHKLLTNREQRKRIKLYRKGFNDIEIGNRVGRTREAIQQWRSKLELNSNAVPKPSPNKLIRRAVLYNKGYKDKVIARKQNVNVMAIIVWRFRRGLPPN